MTCRQVEDAARHQHGSIIDQDIEAPEGVEGALDHGCDLFFTGDISLDGQRTSTQRLNGLRGFIDSPGQAWVRWLCDRAATTMSAPSAANAKAMSLPIPLELPVTIATFPASFIVFPRSENCRLDMPPSYPGGGPR